MAKLANVTRETRLILKIGGIILGAFFLIYLLFQGYSLVKRLTSPPAPPLQAFGKLPPSSFPSVGAPDIKFHINTVDGSLPTFPDRADVYKLIMPQAGLLDLSNTKATLESAGFIENQTKISDTLYQWTQNKTGVIIQYDIVTRNFTISSQYLTNLSLSSSTIIPGVEDIKGDILSFLQIINVDTSDIDIEKSTVTYLQNNGGQLGEAENLANAKYAKIQLVQKMVGDIPFVYETPNSSLLNFIVSYPTQSSMLVVEGQFYHYRVNLDERSDYPIKTSTQAFEDLKNGNGYMINPKNLTEADITNVELRYYVSKEMKGYLLPVYLFTGINFTGYVEAIPSSSLATQ